MSASPWGESTGETTYESFASESPLGEGTYGEGGYGETPPSGESEWDSPFAPAEAEEEIGMESPQQFGGHGGYEYGQEYNPEAYAYGRDAGESEWESPFTNAEEEIMPPPNVFPTVCGDTTYNRKEWKYGKNTDRPGKVSNLTFVPRAEVFEFAISDFDVDRHNLKRQHHDAIADFTRRVLAGIREQRYSGEPIRVFTYGEASSTASHLHNLELSHNRAFNTLHAIRCAFQKAGISVPVHFGFYGTGEVHARTQTPDQTETPQFRGVVVRAFAPLKACKDCKQPPGPKPPGQTTTTLCVSVPKIQPRNAAKLPPDVIPLGSIVPGLKLPVAIVTKAQATIRVDERRSRQSGTYQFQGWGLEFALPPGRTRIDLQADLRASLEVLVRASASLTAKLRLGPLKLALKIDASAFAHLVAKLCAQIRLRIDVDLGRPNIPELRECRLTGAQGVRGAFPFAALGGPAVLLVPGAGYGPAVINFAGGGVAGLGLSSNPMLVPADKSTVKSLLALGGTLQLQNAGGVRREAEYELTEAEWPEAFAELQPELAPFV